jgi:hypothetical protein
MSFKTALVIATCLSATLSSCTRTQRSVEVSPQRPPVVQGPGVTGTTPTVTPAGPDSNGVTNPDGTTTVTTPPGDETATVPVTLSEADLKQYGDTTKMKYKFSYLTTVEEKPITFTAGAAQIVISKLPVGQAGQIVLEIYEETVLKLRGVKDNYTLAKGVNNGLNLQLSAPDATTVNPGAGGAGTTDLTIDVTLDNGSGSGTPGSGGNGSGSGSAAGSGSATVGSGSAAGSGSDPLADWDGKSFRYNGKWHIEPVKG